MTLLQHSDRTLFDPSLVLMQRDGPYLEDVPDDVIIYDLRARSLWTSWLPLARLLRRERPDILFSPGGTNVAAVIAKALSGVGTRVVLSERNILAHSGLTLKRRLMIALQRLFYPWADCVTAVSQGVKDDMVAKLGLPSESIEVIYNPIVDDDLQTLAGEPIDHPWFQEDIPIILGAGRLVPQKNFQMLLRAFAEIRARQPARLVILGEGPLQDELTALAEQLKVADDVWLAGFDKNPFKYMAKADIFVLSSLHEGLPGVLIQAMACGTAVIATDCPFGPDEIIKDGEDGFLVAVNDVDGLAERMMFLLSHPEERMAIGALAQLNVQRFKIDRVLQNYYHAIVGKPVASDMEVFSDEAAVG
ncbi:MAG: glycosyltransferase [Nitrospinaceae bacterium]|nr:glycosyltransferase [Nitrospinaceae bacterium]